MFDKISRGKYHFDHAEFKECSSDVIDLIKKLLVVDPAQRFSASQALKHVWFKKMLKASSKNVATATFDG